MVVVLELYEGYIEEERSTRNKNYKSNTFYIYQYEGTRLISSVHWLGHTQIYKFKLNITYKTTNKKSITSNIFHLSLLCSTP